MAAIQNPWPAEDGYVLVTPWVSVSSRAQLCEAQYDDDNWFSSLFHNCNDILPTPDGEIVFTVKRRGELVYKHIIKIENEQVVATTNGYDALAVLAVSGEDLFFDFTTRDRLLATRFGATARAENGSNTPWTVPFSDNVTMSVNSLVQDTRDDEDGDVSLGSSSVMILIREGATILEKRRLTIPGGTDFTTISEAFEREIAEGSQLYFDVFSAESHIQINEDETSIWTRYPGAPQWQVPRTGKIAIDPILTFKDAAAANGDLTVKVYRNNQYIGERKYLVNNGELSNVGESPVNPFPLSFNVNKDDDIRAEFWTTSHQLSTLLESKGDISIDYIDTNNWIVPDINIIGTSADVDIDVSASLAFDFQGDNPDGEVEFKVLRNNEVLASQLFKINQGRLVSPGGSIKLTVKESDRLNFVFNTTDESILSYLVSHNVQVAIGNNGYSAGSVFNALNIIKPVNALYILMPKKAQTIPVQSSAHHYPYIENLFGEIYRGWAQAAYLANGDLADQKIDTGKLVLPETEAEYTNYETDVYPAFPSFSEQRWNSVDPDWNLGKNHIQSTRRGQKFIDLPKAEDYVRDPTSERTAGIVRTPKFSFTDGYSDGGGYVLTYSTTRNSTSGRLDLMDLNGDRYPDIITSGSVQYTFPDGRMGNVEGVSATRKTLSDDKSLSYGGGTEPPTNARAKLEKASTKPTHAQKVSISGSVGTGDSDGDTDYIDMNGDGLADRVSLSGAGLSVALNLGYRFAGAETWTDAEVGRDIKINEGTTKSFGFSVGWSSTASIFSGGVNLSLGANDVSQRLMDVNGDGLTDFVYVSGDYLKVALNLGSKLAKPVVWGEPLQTLDDISRLGSYGGIAMPFGQHTSLSDGLSTGVSVSGAATGTFTIWATIVPVIDIVFGGGGNYGETVSQPTIGFNDVNGDGYVDSIRSGSDSELEVSLSQIARTNLLNSVKRPLGATINLEYERKGNTYDLPNSRWVMSKAVVFDGAKDDTPAGDRNLGSDYRVMTFDYQDGQYDRRERDFYGFETVIDTEFDTTGKNVDNLVDDDAYRRNTQVYRTDSYYAKGLMVSSLTEEVNDGGATAPYLKTTNEYVLRDVHRTTDPENPVELGPNNEDTATVFPELRKTEKFFFEGQASHQKSTRMEHKYDRFGNVTKYIDFADVGTEDNVFADIHYTAEVSACANDDRYIVGLPTTIQVSNTDGGAWERYRRATYGCQDSTNTDGKLTANLVKVEQFIEAREIAVTDLKYRANGNLIELEGPANKVPERLKLTFDYDDTTDTYPVFIRNESYDYFSTAEYNPKWGKPDSTTDINDKTISYVYDEFGRTQTITGPYEEAEPFTLQFTYNPYVDLEQTPFISMAKTEHFDRDDDGTGTIDTYLFTDGLKRVLQTKKDASVHVGLNQDPKETLIVSGRMVFDGLGRTVRQYYPTEVMANPMGFIDTPDTIADPTEMTYDILDRNLETKIPDGSVTTMDYDFGVFEGRTEFKTTVTDAARPVGRKKTSYRDVRELITGVVEEQGLTTKYRYDFLKQIRQVTDDADNDTLIDYDKLGRRTVIDNPDTGTTETVYDTASNVIRKITANLADAGKAIEYDYDHTRLIGIRYPDFTANEVSYTYGRGSDDEARNKNQIGRIITTSHQGGIDNREYGKLGEVTKETRTVTVASPGNGPIPTYVTQFYFDTFGRLLTLTLPDGEVVTHKYDAGGNVHQITGLSQGEPYDYVKALEYDRFRATSLPRKRQRHSNPLQLRPGPPSSMPC